MINKFEYDGITYNIVSITTENCARGNDGIRYFGFGLSEDMKTYINLEWDLTDDYLEACEAYNNYRFGEGEYADEPRGENACDWENPVEIYVSRNI